MCPKQKSLKVGCHPDCINLLFSLLFIFGLQNHLQLQEMSILTWMKQPCIWSGVHRLTPEAGRTSSTMLFARNAGQTPANVNFVVGEFALYLNIQDWLTARSRSWTFYLMSTTLLILKQSMGSRNSAYLPDNILPWPSLLIKKVGLTFLENVLNWIGGWSEIYYRDHLLTMGLENYFKGTDRTFEKAVALLRLLKSFTYQ